MGRRLMDFSRPAAAEGLSNCLVKPRLRSEDFPSMRRKLIIDGRRILEREALGDVDLIVLGG